jgi:hypothetical protein
MSEPFRTASTGNTDSALASLPTAQAETPKSPTEKGIPGLFTYKSLNNEPYTVKHFGLKQFWDSETAEMRESIESLDDWVQQQARKRGLEDKPESYQEIVDEILKQIGKSENEKPHKTFERVSKASQAMQRLQEAKLPQVLDVNTLTPEEFKDTRA